MLKNYYKVRKALEENKSNIFDNNAKVYWKSLSFFKKIRVANNCEKLSQWIIFETFERGVLETLKRVIDFHGISRIIKPKIMKTLSRF